MDLEQMEIVVDVTDQAGLARHHEHGADAACGESLDAIAEFVVDVGGGDHGLVALRFGEMDQSVATSPLAFPQEPALAFSGLLALAFSLLLQDNNHHSKPSVGCRNQDPSLP